MRWGKVGGLSSLEVGLVVFFRDLWLLADNLDGSLHEEGVEDFFRLVNPMVLSKVSD
ncbi:MAG: hypothetical protein NPIRA05_00970 [Nitrospirales bacterium]|nr:MAG: hypothetical protein NPIRA05_00970 [Nitrospirales bacterium]